jgi:PTS system nitrogen regulatory IIA component
MPYQNMTLEEFAHHVGLDAREVKKLAERDKLPAQRIAGKWRFNRAEVTEWLQQEMLTLNLDEHRLKAIEKAMSEAGVRDVDDHLVTAMISLKGIDLSLPARTKSSVLLELAQLADKTGLLWDAPGLLLALQQREGLCSTGLPNGIAIPHPRQPMPYVSSEPFICFARLGRGIGFGSPYGGLTDMFFLICCHDDRHHLHVLARLMRMLDDNLVQGLRNVETPEAALAMLIEREEAVVKQAAKK